ncbi:MAG: 1,4-alpha-glucan branching enzyme GlgB [Chloroflexota bacterium]|nr:MAG: 1,4-alpha-glucan branching enzyme GlgB [Chloroflexota bacterium]
MERKVERGESTAKRKTSQSANEQSANPVEATSSTDEAPAQTPSPTSVQEPALKTPSDEGAAPKEATPVKKEKPAPPKPKATVDDAQIEAIVGGYHGAPYDVLGPHVVTMNGKEGLAVRVFRPLDKKVEVLEIENGKRTPMVQVHPAGFFEATFSRRKERFPYRLVVTGGDDQEYELEDPYRFPMLFPEFDLYLHGEGNFLESYERFGAHMTTVEGVAGVHFAVWAPNALRVSVIGSFNAWDNRVNAMQRRGDSGIWETFIPNLPKGTHYKYSIKSRMLGYEIDKADPYGFYFEMRPTTDARVWDIDSYIWNDKEWMENRIERQATDKPMSIYEVHLGSWRRGEGDAFLNYRDLAHQLVEYVKRMGYTHIELLPITEHPFDGSWGYQVTGYYAPTSRFGSPDDFMYFVDYCHQNGIGVLLDWVPAHFPRDAHGLAFFDGTHLYEHADPRQGEHRDWGTKIFNFGRNEVRNFLLSNALFWLKKYHLDGLRVDAVASMLYLDYSRQPGEWIPNKYGGRENLEAIDFLRRFNELVHEHAPGAITCAEESTSWPMVTRPTYMGGLGFDYKWNMGWMHDTLSYMEKDPIYRRYHQNEITFSLIYAFHENFILPFSHDEVVHLKKSMLDKMPGDVWQKYANLRALYAYMFGHPGKKLLFMGGEFGQWSEWSEARSLDWHLLQWEDHQRLQRFVRDLNHFYQHEPALYEVDYSWEGFQWIDFTDADQSVISFQRRAKEPSEMLIFVCNFTPVVRESYRIGLPISGVYREVLNSDWTIYGGSGVANTEPIIAQDLPWQNCKYSAPIRMPPLGVFVLKPMQLTA